MVVKWSFAGQLGTLKQIGFDRIGKVIKLTLTGLVMSSCVCLLPFTRDTETHAFCAWFLDTETHAFCAFGIYEWGEWRISLGRPNAALSLTSLICIFDILIHNERS